MKTKNISRIRIALHDIVEVEVESDELPFSELKNEALNIFKFAKDNMFNTKPSNNDVA